jgi:hypothetical protein
MDEKIVPLKRTNKLMKQELGTEILAPVFLYFGSRNLRLSVHTFTRLQPQNSFYCGKTCHKWVNT